LKSDWWNSIHDDFMTCLVLLVAFQGWRVWRDLQSEQMRTSELERQLAVSRLDAHAGRARRRCSLRTELCSTHRLRRTGPSADRTGRRQRALHPDRQAHEAPTDSHLAAIAPEGAFARTAQRV
jgi:hypothetical protein